MRTGSGLTGAKIFGKGGVGRIRLNLHYIIEFIYKVII